ncbi:MAG: phosphatase PAP2 family protein [Bacteroidales bacterium]
MLEKILSLDTTIFYAFNRHRCEILDWGFSIISSHITIGIIITIIVSYVMYSKHFKFWWLYIVIIALCFLLADRISVLCFKDIFCRLRPSHALSDSFTVKLKYYSSLIYDNKGGLYGFVSSHAANTFSIITSMILIMRHQKTVIFNILLILWGILTGISRIYCGYHYPGDVLCGALLGIILGIIVYLLYDKILKYLEKKTERKKV